MLSRFKTEIINQKDLGNFFKIKYLPTFDFPHVEDVFRRTLELAFDTEDAKATRVIHACYDLKEEQYCGFLNLGTTTDIDDLVSIAIEFIFVEPTYRKRIFEELYGIKLSEYLLVDYVIDEIGTNVKESIGINTVALVPIADKVRNIYEEMGFQSIPKSGKNEFEDWMVFAI